MKIPTVAQQVIDMARRRFGQIALTTEQERVAAWLRGNALALETLTELFNARIKARTMLPISSTPMDSVIYRARDREVCDIIAELSTIYRSPIATGTTGSEEQADG